MFAGWAEDCVRCSLGPPRGERRALGGQLVVVSSGVVSAFVVVVDEDAFLAGWGDILDLEKIQVPEGEVKAMVEECLGMGAILPLDQEREAT